MMDEQKPSSSGIKGLLLSPKLKETNRIDLSKCILCQKTQAGIPLSEPSTEGKATLKRAAEIRDDAGDEKGNCRKMWFNHLIKIPIHLIWGHNGRGEIRFHNVDSYCNISS